MKKIISKLKLKNERGVTVIIVTVVIVLLIGFVAFAIDIGYTYVARNQVQNAADAGALAGARFLINAKDTINGPGANLIAYNAATANTSTGNPVTVTWTSGTNGPEVQRGHWTFWSSPPLCPATGTNDPFCPNANLTQTNLFAPGLDTNLNFINAVQVITHNTQIPSFFGKILGWLNYQTSAQAVAYIGFAGKFGPGDFDQPIAICSRSIGDDNNNGIIDDPDPTTTGETGEETLTCNIGRMLNSSGNTSTSNTAGWTNFTQPCVTANKDNVLPYVCTGATPSVNPGSIGTTGGVVQSILTPLRNCWLNNPSLEQISPANSPDQPWQMTLPVILCTGSNVANCSQLVGAINLSVVWISDGGFSTTNPPDSAVPYAMYNPTLVDAFGNPDPNGSPKGLWTRTSGNTLLQDWSSFANWFNLTNQDGSDAPLDKKAIYFMPACDWADPIGTTGGNFFGVTAEIPVLVD